MLSTLIAIALGLSGGGDGDPPKADFQIVLKATAMTRGVDVQLSDLVDIQPAGQDALALGQLVFAPAPVPGYARTITRNELLQALVLSGQPAERFQFKGPSEVVVQSVTTEIPAQELTDAANTVLRVAIDQAGADVEAELVSRVRHIQAPPGRRSLELLPRVRRDLSRGSATVEVDIMVDGARWKTLPLQFQLTHFAPMVKTTGPVRAGTLLGPENLEVVREKQLSATDFLAHKLEEVTGMVAKRDLKSSQSLGLLDYGPPAVIHRGELVTVVLTKGNVKVTAKAIATQDAPQGEALTLVNPTSGAKMRGVATAPGLVVVQGN